LNELMTRAVSTVTINGSLSLSVASQGDDSGPTLVLLPGPTDSWRSYQMILDLLPPSIRTIAVSQRGHGDSDKPATGYRVEHFASDVVPLLDALSVERAVLAGHSGSCLVARRVAIDHPERVAGLVLEASPTTLVGDTRLQRFVESVVLRLEDPIAADFARAFVVDTSSDDMAPEVVDQFVEDLLKVPARVWRETFEGLLQYDDLNQSRASRHSPVALGRQRPARRTTNARGSRSGNGRCRTRRLPRRQPHPPLGRSPAIRLRRRKPRQTSRRRGTEVISWAKRGTNRIRTRHAPFGVRYSKKTSGVSGAGRQSAVPALPSGTLEIGSVRSRS
jgi:pimeloyl-ACP methyl ester carboxylesterase